MSDSKFVLPYSTETLRRKGKGFKRNDIFNYEHFGKFLQNLLDDTSEPKTVSIHGAWGSGKTVFVEMWKEHMEDKGFSVIYFDAFKHDYQSDAFLSLTKALCTYFENLKIVKFKNKTKKLAKIFLINFASTVSKGMIDQKAIDAIFKDCEKEEEIINDFKEALSQLIQRKNDSKPLIFIIDELDRCRPDFALEILEKVKHVFNTDNLHFVFAVNLNSLENSVQKAYGVNKQYLQKFFKFSLALPQNAKKLSWHESDSLFENTNSYISYFFGELKNKKILHAEVANLCAQLYIDIVSIKNRHNKSFTIRDFQRIHDYFLFGVRCLPANESLLAEDNKYYILLQHYFLSIKFNSLFRKLGGIVYSTKNTLESAISAVDRDEISFLKTMGFNSDLNVYDRDDDMKMYWDILENMKYLLFSESTLPSP